MTDLENWNLAVASVSDMFSRLPPSRRGVVEEIAGRVRACKEEMHAIVDVVGGAGICAGCGGECCRTGKYHVTVVDLLTYLVDCRELFTPRFGLNACPYVGDRGCLMEPAYRPFNCITFNCDRVERLLPAAESTRLGSLEGELRSLYRTFEELFGTRLMGGVLMNAERSRRNASPFPGTTSL